MGINITGLYQSMIGESLSQERIEWIDLAIQDFGVYGFFFTDKGFFESSCQTYAYSDAGEQCYTALKQHIGTESFGLWIRADGTIRDMGPSHSRLPIPDSLEPTFFLAAH